MRGSIWIVCSNCQSLAPDYANRCPNCDHRIRLRGRGRSESEIGCRSGRTHRWIADSHGRICSATRRRRRTLCTSRNE